MVDGRRGRVMPRGEKSAHFRHGHAAQHGGKSREYLSWRAMRSRCLNPTDPAYPRYGGRGVKISDAWASFELFLLDMGPRPPGCSLDRWPNKDGDYESGNCRWAAPREQALNTRSNRVIEAAGVRKTISEWARDLGVDPSAINYRIKKMGWSEERAVTTLRTTTRGPKSKGFTHA